MQWKTPAATHLWNSLLPHTTTSAPTQSELSGEDQLSAAQPPTPPETQPMVREAVQSPHQPLRATNINLQSPADLQLRMGRKGSLRRLKYTCYSNKHFEVYRNARSPPASPISSPRPPVVSVSLTAQRGGGRCSAAVEASVRGPRRTTAPEKLKCRSRRPRTCVGITQTKQHENPSDRETCVCEGQMYR